MKMHKQILVTLMIVVSVVVMTGCEYDGPIAVYNQKRVQATRIKRL